MTATAATRREGAQEQLGNAGRDDATKSAIIDALLEPFYAPAADPALLVKCARVLLLCDETQYALDHPEQARKGRKGR